jgi:hypothetical protein
MRSSDTFRGPDFKRVFRHLIMVNILVISLDLTILAFQYAGLYEIQTAWKTLAYSFKLKFEFDILHQLVDFSTRGFGAQGHPRSRHMTGSGTGGTITEVSVQEIVGAHTSGSRFSNAAYARMDEHSLKDVPLQKVVKTTEIRIEVEEYPTSDRGTNGP